MERMAIFVLLDNTYTKERLYEYYEYDVVYGDVLIIDSYYRWLFYSSG